MISRRTAFLGGLVLVLLSCVATWGATTGAYAGRAGVCTGLRALDRAPGFGNLVRVLALIQGQYVQTPDMARVDQAALRAAVASLGDPYSGYLTPADYQAVRSSSSGRYSGIGIEVEAGSTGPVVTRVFRGSPAATTAYDGEAPGIAPGLRPGDRVVAVDGVPVTRLDLAAVRARIAGAAGTQVRIEVQRSVAAGPAPLPAAAGLPAAGRTGVPVPVPAAEEPGVLLTFTLTRRPVDVQTVAWKMLGGGVGYLGIEMFNAQTPGEVASGLAALRAAGAHRLVLDLRNNPGGVLGAAVEVSRYFLPGGVVAYLQPRSGARVAFDVPSPRPLSMPFAVLINRNTASAAELLAGAIQDDHAAPLIGEQSFGKGVVQRVFPLSGGAALKLTVARYETPKGRDLGGKGLTPNMVVAFPGASSTTLGDPATDPQLAVAIARLEGRSAA